MTPSVKELSIDQRVQLVEDIWDSIAADQATLSVPESHRELLDRRLDAYEQDSGLGANAGDVLAAIRKRL